MPVRVGINGFGRTGRITFRSAHERGAEFDLVGINDVMDPWTLAHLLRHDSIYGPFPAHVEAADGAIRVDGREIPVSAEHEPGAIPWGELGAEVVIESTGRFRERSVAARHLDAGARKVVISASASEPDVTVALGVNFDEAYDAERHHVISSGACTTICLSPVAKVLHELVGVRHGYMTTVRAYTSTQQLQDGPHTDLRRARAAAVNLIPTSTDAAETIGLVVPQLAGRLNGFAIRAPVATGSLMDLTVESERETSVEEINFAFRERADEGSLAGILAYSESPLVSTDIVRSPYSAVFDAPLTGVVDGTQVNVVAWFDNEWGYSSRLVDLAQRVLVPVPEPA